MKITLSNRLVVLLAERKIRMATDFARLLADHGYTISSSQASRYLKDEMPALSLDFIGAVCGALHCTPNDLFEIKVVCEAGDTFDPKIRLPAHAVITGAADAVSNAAPASAPTPALASVPAKADTDKTKTPWTGKHPAAGPKMSPIPAIGPKK